MPNWQLQHTGSVCTTYGQYLPTAHRVRVPNLWSKTIYSKFVD